MHCHMPVQAAAYYSKSGSLTHLGEALLHDDNLPGMEELCVALPEQHAMLLRLSARFQAAGLVQQAVDAFCKVPDTSALSYDGTPGIQSTICLLQHEIHSFDLLVVFCQSDGCSQQYASHYYTLARLRSSHMHSVPEVHKPSDTCTAETERPEPILIANEKLYCWQTGWSTCQGCALLRQVWNDRCRAGAG